MDWGGISHLLRDHGWRDQFGIVVLRSVDSFAHRRRNHVGVGGDFLNRRVDCGELGRHASRPVGDEAPVHPRTGALAFLVQPDDGDVVGGGNVEACGKLPFGSDKVELALDRGIIRGNVAATHESSVGM
jgi:hypothetical protein